MNESQLFMCLDCANKQSNPQLPKGSFYCRYAQGVFPDGIVSFDIDATECVRIGVFKAIKAFNIRK